MKNEEIEYIENDSLEVNQKKEGNSETSLIKEIAKQDFDYARNNIKTIIDTGMDAVENLSRIARESELPRAYECLTTLLQINAINNTMLLEMDKSLKDMIDGKAEKEGDTITNNTLFIGTTTDIQRMIEDKIKSVK